MPERGSRQSRTPLLGLEAESPRWRSKIAVGTRFCPGKKGQWETRRNEVEIPPRVSGHLLSALPLDDLLGGWAEPTGEETLPVGALGYSCQAPPCCGLIPFSSLNPHSGFRFQTLPSCLPFLSLSAPFHSVFNFWHFLCSLNSAACEQTDCLTKIEYHTLNPIPGCPSLPEKTFALKTKGTLTKHCPGYNETQVSPKHQMLTLQ